MNGDRIEDHWKQLKGNLRQHWGKLTDDRLGIVAGKRYQMAGEIQKSYGVSRDELKKQLSAWQKQQGSPFPAALKSSHRTNP